MKKLLFLAFCSLFLFAQCNRSKGDAILKLTFKPTFNGSPLLMSQNYPCPDGDTMSIETFNFFVSGIELTRENGKKVKLMEDDALYIDFSNVFTSAEAQTGKSFTILEILDDGFSEIKFSVGVVSSLNSKQPADFPSSNALGDDGNYWTAWDSYIFSRVEGNLDTGRNTSSTLPFLYHAGVPDMLQTRTFSKTFATIDNQTTELVFEVDAATMFYKSDNLLDIRTLNVSHTAAPTSPGYPFALKSIQNLAAGISIQ